MAKTWSEVENSEAFKSLPASEKVKAKNEYWNTVVTAKPEFNSLSELDKIGAYSEFIGQQENESSFLKDLSTYGPMARGTQAVREGLTAKDIPYLGYSAVSGAIANAPETLAKSPIAGFWGKPSKTFQFPFVRPSTEAGQRLGGELQLASGLVPTEVVGSFAPKAARRLEYGLRGGLKGTTEKAEKIASEILQPEDIARAEELGRMSPSVREYMKIAKPTKSYRDIAKSFREAIGANFRKRAEIIRGDNFKVEPKDYTKELADLYNKMDEFSQTEPKDIATITRIAQREILKSNVKDRVSAEVMKERLGKLAQPLLDKRSAGTLTGNESAKLMAYDALRAGLRRVTIGGNKEVADLNNTYEGLREGLTLASKRFQESQKLTQPGVLGNIVSNLPWFSREPGYGATRTAYQILKTQKHLGSKTKQVAKLYGLAREFGTPPIQTPQYAGQLGHMRTIVTPPEGYSTALVPTGKVTRVTRGNLLPPPLSTGEVIERFSGRQIGQRLLPQPMAEAKVLETMPWGKQVPKTIKVPMKIGVGWKQLTPGEASVIERTKQYPELKYMIEQFLKGE